MTTQSISDLPPAVQQIQYALDAGPFPGVWTVSLSVFDNDGYPESVIQSADASATIAVTLEFGPNNPHMRKANADFIAAANPANMREVLAERKSLLLRLEAAEQRERVFREALEPFANIAYFPNIVEGFVITLDDIDQQAALQKAFAKARAALALPIDQGEKK